MDPFDYHLSKKVHNSFLVIILTIYPILFILDRISQIKSENSLEYPFKKNVYPLISELVTPESLMVLQVL